MAAPAHGQWTSGLCDCFTDFNSCYCAWCCPCVIVGRLVNILDSGNTSCCVGGCIYTCLACLGLPCLYTCNYRRKLRERYGLPEQPCDDCCTDWCCMLCSITQSYRELKNRNIDPSLGYQATQSYPTSAPPAQSMNM